MTADREVLRTRLIDAMRAGNRSACDCDDCMGERLDALLAHPVELLALLAEPQVCETCGGLGLVQGNEYDSGIPTGVGCDDCNTNGSVAVDVLDLLVQAGLLERRVTTDYTLDGHIIQERHWFEAGKFAAKDGTP